jgi:hypothetical protein
LRELTRNSLDGRKRPGLHAGVHVVFLHIDDAYEPFSEEIILWATDEFKSLTWTMPSAPDPESCPKKNPDVPNW